MQFDKCVARKMAMREVKDNPKICLGHMAIVCEYKSTSFDLLRACTAWTEVYFKLFPLLSGYAAPFIPRRFYRCRLFRINFNYIFKIFSRWTQEILILSNFKNFTGSQNCSLNLPIF